MVLPVQQQRLLFCRHRFYYNNSQLRHNIHNNNNNNNKSTKVLITTATVILQQQHYYNYQQKQYYFSTRQTTVRNQYQYQQQPNGGYSQSRNLLASVAAATTLLATGCIITSQTTTTTEQNYENLFSSIIRTTKLEESSPTDEIVSREEDIDNNNKIVDSSSSSSNAIEEEDDNTKNATTVVLNWSGTHAVEVPNNRYYEPTSIEEVEEIVKYCYNNNLPLRPVGSALSPNGIAFHNEGMINMSNIDELIAVDTINQTVTVQAGARVAQVIDMLQPYNLTLPNLASIAEQQMGGFVQVGAHGTGRTIGPVDHYVTAIKLVTPSKGTITLTEKDGEIFHLTKVGLGCFGVVVEITMQCIPAHKLVEHTYVLTRQEAITQLDTLLKQHKHIRYMWIPFVDAVVVVTNDPEDSEIVKSYNLDKYNQALSSADKLKPFTDLLLELNPEANIDGMGFGELRDAVLAYDPLNCNHVKRCNEAEAQFWYNAVGYQIRPSHELLQFDCGGQQWVWEVCFPTGTQDVNNGNDIKFMIELLEGIEKDNDEGIPAHAPIEQRWSGSSSSIMSPAHGPNNGLHTWVGIINYLPSDESIMDPLTIQRQRTDITNLFKGKYCDLMRTVGIPYGATSHWAKIELPNSIYKLIDTQISLQNRYPIHKFNQLRLLFDPKNLLSSPFINSLFGKPQ